eukprot:3570558-Karenia_brevis.AAC.1
MCIRDSSADIPLAQGDQQQRPLHNFIEVVQEVGGGLCHRGGFRCMHCFHMVEVDADSHMTVQAPEDASEQTTAGPQTRKVQAPDLELESIKAEPQDTDLASKSVMNKSPKKLQKGQGRC